MKSNIPTLFTGFLLVLFASCQGGSSEATEEPPQEATGEITISKAAFGQTAGGAAQLYTLKNANGVEVQITNYGGIITSVTVPDREGNFADVVLGFDSLSKYQAEHPYFGAIIGRYGNRIAEGQFTIDGNTYNLPQNDGPNTLHGGEKGFDKRLWQAEEVRLDQAAGLDLTRVSEDGEQGFPGNLNVKVRYLLNNDNEIVIQYEATTDQPTVCNLTNHSYFNLKGAGNGDILNHELMINADRFTPVNANLIPTGALRPVEGSPFDFRNPTPIGERIDADNQQLKYAGGYDHNFVLQRGEEGMMLAASVLEPNSGRFLEVLTTEPGLQFYSGNFLDGSNVGKGGKVYEFRNGFCLETQHFPDSPNQEDFPSTLLRPGEVYNTQTIYRFSVK